MNATNFDLNRYFSRIGYVGGVEKNIATVTNIMRAQLFSVPFENTDVQAGKIISLLPEDIVEKIVTNKRGGYCYEVNGLFAMAMEAMGVPYYFVACRPMFYPVRRPKTHMAVIVELEGAAYMCDLGFGSYGIRAPIALAALDVEVLQDADLYQLSKIEQGEILLKAKVNNEWTNQFSSALVPQEWIDFAPANYLNSTHPDAIFVQKLLIVQMRPEGRDILLGDTLKIVKHGSVEVSTLTEAERVTVLRERFGLTLAA